MHLYGRRPFGDGSSHAGVWNILLEWNLKTCTKNYTIAEHTFGYYSVTFAFEFGFK